MRFLILSSLAIFMISCSTETCETCDLIFEDNSVEAQFFCNGLANSYPNGYIESSRTTFTELCQADKDALKVGIISTTPFCSGAVATLRNRLVCN